ncbi:unnamed protein product [Candidula unifasciata]|uniref:Secreted protein n=1 Tax=Candidula unifasciata TaxID=100452 RepID=A0A8S3ZA03_9EUPU|nr:unnamed protein product [Candidula unifasciata]
MIAWTSVCLLCLAWTLWLDPSHAADVREDFLEELSGVFTDASQIQDGDTNRDVLEFRIRRVDVPALQPALALYFVELIKGQPFRRTVLGVSPAVGKKLLVVQYNISESKYPSSKELGPADLSTLTLDDLETRPQCNAIFQLLIPTVYSGNWADCRHLVEGEHPLYLFTITCKGINLEPPVGAAEKSAIVPYELKRVVDSPQLTNKRPADVSPCDSQQ